MIRNIALILFVLVLPTRLYSHGSYTDHVNDMYAVFGFERNPKLDKWMKFISSDMIDKPGSFYKQLQEKYPGFQCKHRLLFHWGYDKRPWSDALENRVVAYCNECNKSRDSIIPLFKEDLKIEQKRRNRLINQKTEELLGFAHGGRDAVYARFFASTAYNIHLLGDYTSDNIDLEGVENIVVVIESIVKSIKDLDKRISIPLIKGIQDIAKTNHFDVQKKADTLMAYLKKYMPLFILKAQEGSIARRLEKRGFLFTYNK